ncbi:MAG: hypothetical protein JXB88_22885 [Spirochaetales bacterium]|nr:hypothetical protein [Spirochaetales bacterium]
MKNILIKVTSIISLITGCALQGLVFCEVYPGFPGNLILSNPALLAVYAFATLAIIYGLYFFYDPDRPLLFTVYILPVLFIPFYGVFGSLAAALYNFSRKKITYHFFLEEQQMLTPLDDYLSGEDSWEIIRDKKWAQSYFHIMSGTNKNLKKLMLKKIMDENILHGVKLLNIALKDRDYEIRSFAAVVLNKLENDINQKILSAKRQMQLKPEDFQARLDLIRMYYSFCTDGLIDTGTLDYYISLAASLLDELEQQSTLSAPEKLEVLLWKARIAHYTGNQELESRIYHSILADYPGHADTLANSCSLAFSRRDFKQLTSRCLQWMAAGPHANPLGEAIKTWIGKIHP